MKKRPGMIFALFFLALCRSWSFSPLEEGQKLLMENKPEEALPLLEEALNADPSNEIVYLYLGIVYEQLELGDKAIGIMRRGLNVAARIKDVLYYNIGNGYLRQTENTVAEEMYSQAIQANGGFADPYLNRANARLNQEKYAGALNDYTIYLKLEPDTSQRAEIERMISLLKDYLTQRIEQERVEKARENALMNEVLNSLRNASEDAQNLTTGSGGFIEEQEEEIDIDE